MPSCSRALVVVFSMLVAAPAMAGHANPWATPEDILLNQFHDENQLASIGTPGEDEMRGTLVRAADGRIDGDVSGSRGSGGTGTRGGGGGRSDR